MITRIVEKNDLIIKEDAVEILRIKEEHIDDSLLITLSGSLNSAVVHDFEDEMMAIMTLHLPIEVNMKKVSYLSGSALNTFLMIQKEIDRTGKGSLVIKDPSDATMKTFEENGFTDLIEISGTTSI